MQDPSFCAPPWLKMSLYNFLKEINGIFIGSRVWPVTLRATSIG